MTAPLTYSITEAAARLGAGFTVDWLRKHMREIPHIKSGDGTGRAGRVSFTEEHLVAIVKMQEVVPDAPSPQQGRITRRRAS